MLLYLLPLSLLSLSAAIVTVADRRPMITTWSKLLNSTEKTSLFSRIVSLMINIRSHCRVVDGRNVRNTVPAVKSPGSAEGWVEDTSYIAENLVHIMQHIPRAVPFTVPIVTVMFLSAWFLSSAQI